MSGACTSGLGSNMSTRLRRLPSASGISGTPAGYACQRVTQMCDCTRSHALTGTVLLCPEEDHIAVLHQQLSAVHRQNSRAPQRQKQCPVVWTKYR